MASAPCSDCPSCSWRPGVRQSLSGPQPRIVESPRTLGMQIRHQILPRCVSLFQSTTSAAPPLAEFSGRPVSASSSRTTILAANFIDVDRLERLRYAKRVIVIVTSIQRKAPSSTARSTDQTAPPLRASVERRPSPCSARLHYHCSFVFPSCIGLSRLTRAATYTAHWWFLRTEAALE